MSLPRQVCAWARPHLPSVVVLVSQAAKLRLQPQRRVAIRSGGRLRSCNPAQARKRPCQVPALTVHSAGAQTGREKPCRGPIITESRLGHWHARENALAMP